MGISSETVDGYEDPLAVIVGEWTEEDMQQQGEAIPAEGWPKDFKPEVIGRILRYLPED